MTRYSGEGHVNVGTGEEVTILELAELVARRSVSTPRSSTTSASPTARRASCWIAASWRRWAGVGASRCPTALPTLTVGSSSTRPPRPASPKPLGPTRLAHPAGGRRTGGAWERGAGRGALHTGKDGRHHRRRSRSSSKRGRPSLPVGRAARAPRRSPKAADAGPAPGRQPVSWRRGTHCARRTKRSARPASGDWPPSGRP